MDFLLFLVGVGAIAYLAGIITPSMIQKVKDFFKR